ncbi:MAG: PEPxxWA-CTERM sorting domain-containing protein [Sphingopyxis sp.]|nr:PEPxxWA-CTERM sorting domain-containing protein [Sphingopyxis sp.]
MRAKSRVKLQLFAAALAATALSSTANAADFIFNDDPFAGTTVLQTPGRQVVGNELSIPDFNIATDRLLFNPSVFGLTGPLSFANSLAANLPGSGVNFISLQDIDADGNVANGVLNNAGLSANLIAANTNVATPGFFIYFNSGLNLNRLVYSTDLSSSTADLRVLARFTNQTGTGASAALQQFSAANIGVVPEPSVWAMMILGFGVIGGAMRQRKQQFRLKLAH